MCGCAFEVGVEDVGVNAMDGHVSGELKRRYSAVVKTQMETEKRRVCRIDQARG